MKSAKQLQEFARYLQKEERSPATIEKYVRDVVAFLKDVGNNPDKWALMEYKKSLLDKYAVNSANSKIASINTYMKYCGKPVLCVKQYKVQREAYSKEEKELSKEEYKRLVIAAKRNGNERLNLLLQTICGTGIRVSELQYITVEAVQKGEAVVHNKGKIRRILIVPELKKKLLKYAKQIQLCSGSIFVTKNGKAMNRSNIWREMKSLCKQANVEASKVFPHNLRHLFARMFYGIEKDIAKLADILGHSNINTTRIYIKSTGEEHRRKMQNLKLII